MTKKIDVIKVLVAPECQCGTPDVDPCPECVRKMEEETKTPHQFETNSCGGSQCKGCGCWMSVPQWPPYCDERLRKQPAPGFKSRPIGVCLHDWQTIVLTSHPPQYREICRKCGVGKPTEGEPEKCDPGADRLYAGKLIQGLSVPYTKEQMDDKLERFAERMHFLDMRIDEKEADETAFRVALLDYLERDYKSRRPECRAWVIEDLRKRFTQ